MKRICMVLVAGAVGCAQALQFPEAALAQTEKVLHSFGGGIDGSLPFAGLINVKGTLFGTTYQGGGGSNCGTRFGCGTVFSVKSKTGAETVLYSFCSKQRCTDGENPYADLIDVAGTLYGTALRGGASDYGVAFAIDSNTGAETALHSFGGGADGESPDASLIAVNGMLYGATYGGGSFGYGTVFSLDPTSGAEQVLYSFCSQQNCTDGKSPQAGLIDVNGTLYGTTEAGGVDGFGTVFALDPNTGAETVLHSFSSAPDGMYPDARLIDIKGTLYGTTALGGDDTFGTVFALNLSTGTETILYGFVTVGTGMMPLASLIDVKKSLYGTTYSGGNGGGCADYGCGTVFSLDLESGAETVVHSFGVGTDGRYPYANLANVNGTLYGTTELGGAYGTGTVFAISAP